MLLLALAVGGYIVRTGGSAMHYYYLAAPFTFAVCSTAGLLELAAARLGDGVRMRWFVRVGMIGLTVLVGSWYPAILDRHPVTGAARMEQEPSNLVLTDPAFWRERTEGNWPSIADMEEFAPTLHREGYAEWNLSGVCRLVYNRFDQRSVHRFGLTDGVLARVDTPEHKRGHKPGLKPMAQDIALLQHTSSGIGRGMFREAVEDRRAPRWVVRQIDTIELIERKMYNRHDLIENLGLALTFPPKLKP